MQDIRSHYLTITEITKEMGPFCCTESFLRNSKEYQEFSPTSSYFYSRRRKFVKVSRFLSTKRAVVTCKQEIRGLFKKKNNCSHNLRPRPGKKILLILFFIFVQLMHFLYTLLHFRASHLVCIFLHLHVWFTKFYEPVEAGRASLVDSPPAMGGTAALPRPGRARAAPAAAAVCASQSGVTHTDGDGGMLHQPQGAATTMQSAARSSDARARSLHHRRQSSVVNFHAKMISIAPCEVPSMTERSSPFQRKYRTLRTDSGETFATEG